MSSVEHSFHVPPFPPFPSAERYVPVGSQDEALQRIQRAIEAWEAISLVIGPPGVGKSLLCQLLLKQFAGRREVVVLGDAMLDNPLLFQRHLLTRLNRVRGIHSTPLAPNEDPQFALVERLARSTAEFPGLLLLVDEAQALTPEVLETIRIITNTMSEGQPRVSAVLLGGPKLDETLALPSLEALVQRVATRCYLHPLNGDEALTYVQDVIKNCGSNPQEAITNEAIRAIHQACSGTPRLINQMMTAAIDCAASLNQSIIDNKIVDRAWATLQQLPSPVMDEPAIAPPNGESSNVEFGSLDDSMWGETSSDEQPASATFASATFESDDDASDLGRRWNDQALPNENEVLAEAETTDCETQACNTSECSEEACQTTGQCQSDQCHSDQCHSDQCQAEPCQGEQLPNGSFATSEPTTDQQTSDESLVCEAATASAEATDNIEFGSLSIDCQSYEGDYEMVSDVIGSALATNLPEIDEAESQRCEAPVAATPTADQLFGEFDDEEEIKPTVDALVASVDPVAECDANDHVASDLETSLHEEILSMRGAANSPLSLLGDDANDMDEVCEEAQMGEMQNQSAMAASAPVLWIEEDGEDIAVNHDDRDMLVIEDDVQVETAALHHESADVSAGRPVAVDFQAMLAKMRSPQS
ncbi:ExeA family protein [Rhodopirellula sp. P2]|uniref:ExeA family protein n=1 Tax=Rhodopirellula sp. P2 TaxID=2127060 RepID=UPI002368B6BD|nr:AAA family ATPase [Rhodopirellula sp. P2]WDQ15845.1 AAA family ATPase [Rhodopirellula sp. P2]